VFFGGKGEICAVVVKTPTFCIDGTELLGKKRATPQEGSRRQGGKRNVHGRG